MQLLEPRSSGVEAVSHPRDTESQWTILMHSPRLHLRNTGKDSSYHLYQFIWKESSNISLGKNPALGDEQFCQQAQVYFPCPCSCDIKSSSFQDRDQPGMVAHAFNPSNREAEAGGFLSLRPAWSTEFQDSQDYMEKPGLGKT